MATMPNDPAPLDVAALDALYRATTQDTFVVEECASGAPMVRGEEHWHFVAECGVPPHGRHEANAAWIAAVHNAWPALCAEVKRLRARVAALEAECQREHERSARLVGEVIEESGVAVPIGGLTAVEAVAALRAENARLRDALDTIAHTGTNVAPGMDPETSLRWTANDCIRTAARALSAEASRV